VTTPWSKIALVYLAGIVSALQLGVIAPIVPLLQHDLDLSLPFVGAILSCVTLISVLFGTVAGTWTNRFGLVRAAGWGLALMTAAAALATQVADGTMLLAIRAVAGIGYLLTVVACPPLIARLAAERDRAFALALWGSFLPVGIAVADVGAALLLEPLGWRGLFWTDAAVTAATCVAAAIGLRGRAPGVAHSAQSLGLWAVYGMRAPFLLMLAFGVFTLTFIVFAAVEPTYLVEARGMALAAAGRVSALTTLAAIPGALIAGGLIRRGVPAVRLAWVGLIAPAALSVLVFVPAVPLAPVIIATILALFLGGLVPAAVYAMIPRIAPDPIHFAPINGLLMQIGSLGTLIGPPLYGAWANRLGWGSSPILLIALAVGGIACLIFVARAALPSLGHNNPQP
jgi:MFS family permease